MEELTIKIPERVKQEFPEVVWSKDRDLKEKQFRVVVVTTEELMKLLGSSSA